MQHHLCGFLLALAAPAFAQTPPVAERVAEQNKLFSEFYETSLKNSPERATSFGDYRYNSLLGQYSLAEISLPTKMKNVWSLCSGAVSMKCLTYALCCAGTTTTM